MLLVVLAPASLAAGAFEWLRDSATGSFTEADWGLVRGTVEEAFANVEDGERRDWSNPDTGSRGAVKPLLSFRHEGLQCRRLAFLNVSERGGRGVVAYTLCRGDDGALRYLPRSEHP
ncbi:MAG: RT0821/Lpp0805 family surface protein [Pseudomonadales bacterium]|nr:RT0821/Lpp0805 family surface protein [Pseudomonadales bacterium]